MFLELAARISARWSASGAWSAATLEAQLGGAANCCAVATSAAPPPPSLPLLTAKVNDDGHRAFSYDEGRLAASARRTQLVEMSARELFELCRRSEVGPSQRRAYFTSPVAALLGGDDLLARHPEWRDLIHPLAARPAAAAAVSAPHLSLWIGGRGTQTQAGRSMVHNVCSTASSSVEPDDATALSTCHIPLLAFFSTNTNLSESSLPSMLRCGTKGRAGRGALTRTTWRGYKAEADVEVEGFGRAGKRRSRSETQKKTKQE